MDELAVRIGKRVKDARKAAGLSQSTLAEKMDVSLRAVQQWESGERLFGIERIARLSAVLHVSQSWLLGEGETVSEDDRLARLERELRALRSAVEEVLRRLPEPR